MVLVKTKNKDLDLPLDKTALLVIDMQNDFVSPTLGYLGSTLQLDTSPLQAILPAQRKVLEWAQRNGLNQIIFTRESHRPDLSDLPASKKLRYKQSGSPIGAVGPHGKFLVRGEKCCEIIGELQPYITSSHPTTTVLDKPAHSCFVGTDLHDQLQGRGITHLLFAGVTTQCCVLATYRQASDLGYFCLLLEDCCAAYEAKDHEATVQILQSEGGVLGWVGNSTWLLQSDVGRSKRPTK